jgi:hypothetical protein
MEAYHTESYRGLQIEIHRDEDEEGPREWDNFGTMYCFHRRYNLGDKHDLSIEEVQELAKCDFNEALPLYLYDHSGITMSTSPFSCPWDSGQVGWIVVTEEQMMKEFGIKKLTKEHREKARQIMRGEVEVYDQFLTGDVWGYVIEDEDGEHIDSLWSMYGYDYCLAGARKKVDAYLEHEAKKAKEQIEHQIRYESLELQFVD